MDSKKYQILIVDDEINIIRSIIRVLENDDYNFSYTIDPLQVVDILSNTPIDVIISDQRMPNLTGLGLLMRAKDVSPSTVRILMSAFSDNDILIKAINDGQIYQYINKPWDNEILIKIIASAIQHKSEEDEKKNMLAIQSEKNLYLRYHDILTGLYNRTFLEEEIKRLDVDRQLPLSVIIGDINGLKLINDSFGYETGDKTIIEVANIIKGCCTEEDIIARIGGDEFCILFTKLDEEIVKRICKRIYDKCEQYKNNDKDNVLFINISLGYTSRTISHEPIEVIMKEAEASMYRHKLLETRSLRSSIVSSITSTLKERYIETDEHSDRMKKLSREIGIALGISDSMLDDLELLALLHDIGKISIKDTIINKNAKLTKEEMEEMKRHCENGYNIAQATIEFQHISECILAHHEKWDGSGYPRHIKGEKIPILSRIISVVDAYDAMTNDRPYRQALSQEEAISEIRKCSGTQFDLIIARIFVEKVLKREW